MNIEEAPKAPYSNDLPIDNFYRRIAQAKSLALSIYGQGFEAFDSLNDRAKDNILWLLADLIEEAEHAIDMDLYQQRQKAAKA